MRAELIVDCKNEHGEGIFWNPSDGLVWWTDIQGCALWSFNPETSQSASFPMNERVCCFAPRVSGGLIVAYADRVVLFDPSTKAETLVTWFEPDNLETRLNDGRTDRQGRLIVGGMNEVSSKPDSSVICVDTNLKAHTIIEQVSCANSTCFSPDGNAAPSSVQNIVLGLIILLAVGIDMWRAEISNLMTRLFGRSSSNSKKGS